MFQIIINMEKKSEFTYESYVMYWMTIEVGFLNGEPVGICINDKYMFSKFGGFMLI